LGEDFINTKELAERQYARTKTESAKAGRDLKIRLKPSKPFATHY
jgi:hypothetical protein